ncbi:pantoate--beta-alanine ligase [Thalassobacillus hwangdonensis]|uniref:Pantothenate synthetase n=1 Tax=Thalassobacillus hwangdonensis TaxID=546108 RepID=A0ABW3KZB9_9BACI
MEIIETPKEMQRISTLLQASGKTIGFVPTMGYLHEGHEKLLEAARKENEIVVLSIFVNPLQFGPNEDLDRYPRDEAHDRKVALKHKVDYLFFPHAEAMYPGPSSIELTVKRRADVLCGRSRQGHFDGVVTVLSKLFNLCRPSKTYFGLKDAQQVAVVDALIEDFNFPVELVPVPTVREADGLAKSSRNVYLSEQERKEAPFIYQSLLHGKELALQGASREQVVSEVQAFIEERTHGRIDYIEFLSYPDLQQLDKPKGQMILATAVFFEKARLIDNILIDM